MSLSFGAALLLELTVNTIKGGRETKWLSRAVDKLWRLEWQIIRVWNPPRRVDVVNVLGFEIEPWGTTNWKEGLNDNWLALKGRESQFQIVSIPDWVVTIDQGSTTQGEPTILYVFFLKLGGDI